MESNTAVGRAHFIVDLWVEVDLAEMRVDRVIVDMAGLAAPIELTGRGAEYLTPADRQAMLDALGADPWPSWDYDDASRRR